jgi:antitoxin component YwqK of YwqJK toxin-antitoxin module
MLIIRFINVLNVLVVPFKYRSKNETFEKTLRIFGVERCKNMNISTLRKIATLAIILMVCTINSSYAVNRGQNGENETDANGMRQHHWVISNSTRHLAGYSDNAKVEEGDYKDNMKQGVWITYYPSGAVKSKITFKDNRPEGYTVSYYENGNKQEEGVWSNNRWVGPYKLYYDNGNVQHEFKFNDNGKRDSVQNYFYPNGKLMITGNWTGGKQTGNTKEYYDDGSLKADETFVDGNLDPSQSKTYDQKTPTKTVDVIPPPTATEAPKQATTAVKPEDQPNTAEKVFNGEGYWKLYNTNKQISKDGYFHTGRLIDGTVYIYNTDGILQKKAVYKGGVYEGDAPITEEDKK